ncbi:DUF1826 domain-containing protein [Nitrosomonas sp. HPC101]|uniref:DUF1826 domain-containing protein n=1 Tax=Nitrosomonas sp. HPC101 TaxID=1658667 RepID=UPI001369EC4C|nr:DUF1826 domain-containing protein [Nitrosomonas sp. HPC101]MXS85419.1 DUF1826 domain-containing protein [Nitrosomonas sp. HPC101]
MSLFPVTFTLQPYSRVAQHPAELLRIFDAGTQVVRWQRCADLAITTYLRQVTTKGLLSSGFRTCLKANQQLDPIHLPDGSGRNTLADDIHQLSILYHDLLGCSTIGLRLEVLHGAMCPRFHVDRTGIRMVCTYRGPGTEWIDDDIQADRTKLGSGANGLPDTESGLFATDETSIEAASCFDVVLLKGTLWQGNAGQGAIHRSPAVMPSDNPRILLVIDALWDTAS